MAANERSTAVGVFANRQLAQEAVADLRRAGFEDDQIGVVARDGDQATPGSPGKKDRGTKAEEGATTGLAAGAGVGALWAVGIAAGLLPAIGPVIAGGTLAAILASAATGAAAAGLVGALIGLGIPEEEAQYYESQFRAGRVVVTVKANGRYGEADAILQRHKGQDYQAARAASPARAPGAERTIQAREEELHVRKQPVQSGEVSVRKEVHTERKTLEVPVMHEEVVVERHPVAGHQTASGTIGAGEEVLRVPVQEEQVIVQKQPVVKEEVRIAKRKVQDSRTVGGTVRKEEIKVEKQGDADLTERRT